MLRPEPTLGTEVDARSTRREPRPERLALTVRRSEEALASRMGAVGASGAGGGAGAGSRGAGGLELHMGSLGVLLLHQPLQVLDQLLGAKHSVIIAEGRVP